jgi:hypothetical protein
MRKIFYTDGKNKFGPYSLEELMSKGLSSDTKVWYYGLKNWTPLSEIQEFNSTTNSISPTSTKQPLSTAPSNSNKKRKKNNKSIFYGIFALLILIVVIFIYVATNKNKESALYSEIVENSYDTEEDFSFYIDKFYRDIESYNLFPKKPSVIIIKFAKLDQITNTTHIHGLSFGKDNDDKVEIYINPSTWKNFNKPMRYYLMYHELSHDILNVDDLEDIEINVGKLMYPAISTYEKITMDDFIEHSHELFEEVKSKQ